MLSEISHYNKPRVLDSLICNLKKVPVETKLAIKSVIFFAVTSEIVILANNRIFYILHSKKYNIPLFIEKYLYIILIIILLYIIVHKSFLKMRSYFNLSINEKDNSYSIQYESSILFRDLFNNDKEVAVLVKIDKEGVAQNIIDINRSTVKTLGYTKDELLNKTIYDIVDKNQVQKINTAVKQLLECKQVDIEIVAISKNGNRIDLDVDGSVLKLNGENVLLLLSRNITDKKNIERALRESEQRYRKLIELLPDAVHIKQDGRLVYSNEAGVRILGAKNPEQLLGRASTDFVHPDYQKVSKERGDMVITIGGNAPLAESKDLTIDGRAVDVEVASAEIEYNGRPSILSVSRDITERKKAEADMETMMNENKQLLKKAVESEKTKTEFFTNISHEFKTPLNVVLSIIQLLSMKMNDNNADAAKYNKYIHMMKQNCYRLLRLINNLLDITKIDSGYMELNLKNHDIVNIIEDLTLSVAEYAKNNGIFIVFDTEVEEKIMCCDEEKIERIMLNLLSNAIKYNKETGKIFVNIYDKEEYILISVKDTGIGIPEDKLNVIFDRFKQVDASLHRGSEGSGIGLALVKSMVEKHGGEITVNSIYGEGTEFIIKLPVKVLPEDQNDSASNYSANSIVDRINIEFSDIYRFH